MKFEPIITSALEQDYYKFTMGQFFFHKDPEAVTRWAFKCRNKNIVISQGNKIPDDMYQEIVEQIQHFCNHIRFTEDDLAYLAKDHWFRASYINHLRNWRPRWEHFHISNTKEEGFKIETFGTNLDTSMYEIPVLAIVSEVYYRFREDFDALLDDHKNNIDNLFKSLIEGKYYIPVFSEFGLRRRLCAEAQEYTVAKFAHLNDTKHSCSHFVGTSNVYLAKKFGIKAVGTMAHELFMVSGQGNSRIEPAHANGIVLDMWVDEYHTSNGIALTDTTRTSNFKQDFTREHAVTYDGLRHDSGDPYKWGDGWIEIYKGFDIDPMTKTLLFSDSLDFERANDIARYFRGKIKVAFGIGTFLSNNTYAEALNIVMKVVEVNGRPVAKLSDADGKNMCQDDSYIEYLKGAVDWRLEHEPVSLVPEVVAAWNKAHKLDTFYLMHTA